MRITGLPGPKPKADRLVKPAVRQHPGHDHPHYRVMTKHKPLPPVEALNEWFILDLSEGKLYWRKKPARQVPKFAEAGWKQLHGLQHPRWSVSVPAYGRYLRSRVVWKMVTQTDPGTAVDHANGNSLDDRFVNLVDGGKTWNNRNRRCTATSGLMGAYPCNGGRQWMSTIQENGRTKYLGTWATPEEASAAYFAARSKFQQTARAQ